MAGRRPRSVEGAIHRYRRPNNSYTVVFTYFYHPFHLVLTTMTMSFFNPAQVVHSLLERHDVINEILCTYSISIYKIYIYSDDLMNTSLWSHEIQKSEWFSILDDNEHLFVKCVSKSPDGCEIRWPVTSCQSTSNRLRSDSWISPILTDMIETISFYSPLHPRKERPFWCVLYQNLTEPSNTTWGLSTDFITFMDPGTSQSSCTAKFPCTDRLIPLTSAHGYFLALCLLRPWDFIARQLYWWTTASPWGSRLE
jgi:hypothetical protein